MVRLKFSHLQHIHDHGLRMKFDDPKLEAVMENLRNSRDASLTAGKSILEVKTRGNVTFTILRRSHVKPACNTNVHYRDTRCGLDATFGLVTLQQHLPSVRRLANHNQSLSWWEAGEQQGAEYMVSTIKILGHLILGPGVLEENGFIGHEYWSVYSSLFGRSTTSYPDTVRYNVEHQGAGHDAVLRWVTRFGWALQGESGLRAWACGWALEDLQSENLKAHKTKRDLEVEHTRLLKFDLEAEIMRVRKRLRETITTERNTRHLLCRAVEKIQRAISSGKLMRLDLSPESRHVLHKKLDLYVSPISQYDVNVSEKMALEFTDDTKDLTIPPVVKCTHKVWLDGEHIRVSSGITFDIPAARVLAWLRGQEAAPETRYGRLSKIESAEWVKAELKPVVWVKCGCHVVDGRPLGEDFAAALEPRHTVQTTGKKGWPAVMIIEDSHDPSSMEIFSGRLHDVSLLAETQSKDTCRLMVEAAAREVKALRDTHDNREAAIKEVKVNLNQQDEISRGFQARIRETKSMAPSVLEMIRYSASLLLSSFAIPMHHNVPLLDCLVKSAEAENENTETQEDDGTAS